MDTIKVGTVIAIFIIGFMIAWVSIQSLIMIVGLSMDADSVECDWFQCTFKKTLKEIQCYENGEKVPCPEVDIYELHEQDLGNQGQNG